MRVLTISHDGKARAGIYRVVTEEYPSRAESDNIGYALLDSTCDEQQPLLKITETSNRVRIQHPSLLPGDVIRFNPAHKRIDVVFRPTDKHHSLFITNRCNSRCLMCSQPPTSTNDDWRTEESLQIIDHIESEIECIGLTGGEPLVNAKGTFRVLQRAMEKFPRTRVEILTNGRLLFGQKYSHQIASLPRPAHWLVPLYGHADFIHDFIVQSPGAFDQTIGGLLTLHKLGQSVQIRTVLIEPTIEHLVELSYFVCRNLPFASEVALMGCEPIGYALANRDMCAIDIRKHTATLDEAVRVLLRHRMNVVLMNFPLCSLPLHLRQFASQSISDWKQVYADECISCGVKASCCGLFEWHTGKFGWKPTTLTPQG